MIGGQQEALHYIGYVAKMQRIVSSPNNYSLAILHALSNTTKVVIDPWAEEEYLDVGLLSPYRC